MWFEELMGFPESSPENVHENITHEGKFLVSRVNGRRVRCGSLTVPSLDELRRRIGENTGGRPSASEVVGDVGALHRDPQNGGALFQAASQFNLLEMAHPSVVPEHGVGIYESDPTQGPACAISCGGGTIFRNYYVLVGGELGQTSDRQIDCLEDLGVALGGPGLWEMRNGYALLTIEGLRHINALLDSTTEDKRNELRGLLRIGVQHDVEVLGTDHCVTQVYGSALPVAYGTPPSSLWEPFARLVLEASYEATLTVARCLGIARVYLTLLGGGVFGNHDSWIGDAVLRALACARANLDVRIVSYKRPNALVRHIVREHTSHSRSPAPL